ncbi:MAG: hypothetical protein AB1505_33315, partial [Candidatus Latescibacterota bacterium]
VRGGLPAYQQVLGWLGVAAGWALYGSMCVGLGLLRHYVGGEAATAAAVLNGDPGAQAAVGGAGTTLPLPPAGTWLLAPWILPVISVVVPIGVAFLWVWAILPLQDRRRRQREWRWCWEAQQGLRIEAGERQQAVVEQQERLVRALESVRAAARARLQRIAEEAQAAEAQLRATLEAERQYAVAWLQAVEGALHQDRLAFVREALLRGRGGLLQPETSANGAGRVSGVRGTNGRAATSQLLPAHADVP